MKKLIIVAIAMLFGVTCWAGDSAPFLLDTTDPMVKTGGEVSFSYNSSWIGGDPSAEVVISADGTEIKRTTGEGEFVWSPTTAGKHTLTYTTFINGIAQEEVYTATVYADWKYTVKDGKATIVETAQRSGSVTIPSKIDGFPVVGIDRDLFAGCHGLFITVPLSFTNVVSTVKSFLQNEWVCDNLESSEVYKSNDIDHNGSTYMIATVKGPCEFSFDWKVSSESGYDWLRWYLDGSQEAEISGEKSWQTVTYSLPEGEHTIKWQYSKDGSADNGSDCGWVRMNESMAKMDFGDATVIYSDYPCSWGGDANWKNESDGSLRSGKITHGQSSWMDMKVSGAGRLTYKWKSSSEHCLDEVYDYGYLSVDGMVKGVLTDSYSLEGVAIGGETDWQTVDVDVEGEGEHILRWTFMKDGVDEETVGEDCIWVSDLKFRPLTTLSFDIGEASGSAPSSVTELSETVLVLPEYDGFNRPLYTLTGWTDGASICEPGSNYVMRATNVTLQAVYRANTISAPVVNSRSVVNGGVLEAESATIRMSADEGTTIYYTLDGTVPTSASAKYERAFTVNLTGRVTIKAIAIRDNYFDSPVTKFSYTKLANDILLDIGEEMSVVVPTEWIDKYDSIVTAAGGDKAAALQQTAANGRKVWECFMLGVDPTKADDDFKITRFWIEDGKPMFEFSHSTDGAGNSFMPRLKVKGKAKLSDGWSDVPEGGNSAFRFFTVEVALP